MNEFGVKSKVFGLAETGVQNAATVYWNLPVAELVEQTLKRGEGVLADNGSLCVRTGEFTGRSPKDKFAVKDANTENVVWWGEVNNPFSRENFVKLKAKVVNHLGGRELWVRDCYAGADTNHRIAVRVVNEFPWQSVFVNNLFIRPSASELEAFTPDWTILCAPSFKADPAVDGTRQHNFTIIDFTERTILIGGSAYTGEIKKGIFTVMNYLLPLKGFLSMHCSANIGKDGDTAVFFGLSGTGKTTLSSDPNRNLIGDDEHGWTNDGVFNFEGGCYAKCVDLSQEKEPQIWEAVKFGALVENTKFHEGTRRINFEDISITENTRVAYPLNFINNSVEPSVGGTPKNIFFLTADAFGVLPPISRLNPGQAKYQFISGYTAKVAGTEAGVKEPQATFSPCYGQAFLPLHPTTYARLLGELLTKYNVNVWLINTGWSGGPYGVGSRMKLPYTRAMITAALEGKLDNATYTQDPLFGFSIPTEVPGVPS
ncbi:MAG TPA: phosphoenolpyruvate carboxykinase (ATP), partial [Bacteroidia bacterium]|nr:phosphoenolpyruvate carboxykinase (ATP) [Bacteroidia bacterium]